MVTTKKIESYKKQMIPQSSYYVESYPAFPTYCCNAYSVRKIEKFLIDPYDILPTKMVLQSPGGINSITEFDDNEMELINPMEEHKIDHVGLSYILSDIIDEGLLDMIIVDLLAWGITKICNTITNPTLETTTENFCRRAFDYCTHEEELDLDWIFTDEILANIFAEGLSEGEGTEVNSQNYIRLGFPTKAFPNIPEEKWESTIDNLYLRLSSYFICTQEEFKYLLLPTYTIKGLSYQPKIDWKDGSSKQFMRAVFLELFPEQALRFPKGNSSHPCFQYNHSSIPLNKNKEKIADADRKTVKGIISGCYEALGLKKPNINLASD